MNGLPETVVRCGGCGKELNLLRPHLTVQIKAERQTLVASSVDPFSEGDQPSVVLGTQSGRGRIVKFHDFGCIMLYAEERDGQIVKLEPHKEASIYEPEDNRSPEELVDAGELPEEMLAVYAAREEG